MAVFAFLAVFALIIVYLAIQTKRAGPRQLEETDLLRAVVVAKATTDAPGYGWSHLGSRTTAQGLRLKFDHDDDPQAEATFLVDPGRAKQRNTLANKLTLRLTDAFETHHVHTRGYVFRVRLRGSDRVANREIRLQMHVESDGTPYGGRVENDDDTDAAVGGWIDFEEIEILRVDRS